MFLPTQFACNKGDINVDVESTHAAPASRTLHIVLFCLYAFSIDGCFISITVRRRYQCILRFVRGLVSFFHEVE